MTNVPGSKPLISHMPSRKFLSDSDSPFSPASSHALQAPSFQPLLSSLSNHPWYLISGLPIETKSPFIYYVDHGGVLNLNRYQNQNPLESLWEHRLLGSSPRALGSAGLGLGLRMCVSNKFPAMLVLLAQDHPLGTTDAEQFASLPPTIPHMMASPSSTKKDHSTPSQTHEPSLCLSLLIWKMQIIIAPN